MRQWSNRVIGRQGSLGCIPAQLSGKYPDAAAAIIAGLQVAFGKRARLKVNCHPRKAAYYITPEYLISLPASHSPGWVSGARA